MVGGINLIILAENIGVDAQSVAYKLMMAGGDLVGYISFDDGGD